MFEVGDKVIHADFGKGIVTEVDDTQYPYTVIFDCWAEEYFTSQGSLIKDAVRRTLFFCGPNGEFLEERPKKMVKKKVEFIYTFGMDLKYHLSTLNFPRSSKFTIEWEEEE